MGAVFFGDNIIPIVDGDWNNVNNWYSSLGYPGNSSSPDIHGALLGRLPNATTDLVYLTNYYYFDYGYTAITGPNKIIIGPSTPYSGVIYGYGQNFEIRSGIYYGIIYLRDAIIFDGTFFGEIHLNSNINIRGGNFTNTATIIAEGLYSNNGIQNNATFNCPINIITNLSISGGTFNKLITISNNAKLNLIKTIGVPLVYSPTGTITCTWSGNVPTVTGVIPDPGFAAVGGNFSPNYTYVGFDHIPTQQATYVEQIGRLHGLVSASPLSVSNTTISDGVVTQSISDSGTSATVTSTSLGSTGVDPFLMIEDLATIYGLKGPITISDTSRISGTLTQNINTSSGTTTISRV